MVRLIAATVASSGLLQRSLRFSWASNRYDDPDLFLVAFAFEDDYQVFAKYRWSDRSPQELTREVIDSLERDPSTWTGAWLGMTQEARRVPPSIAGSSWERYQV